MDDPVERRFDPGWRHPEWGHVRPGWTPDGFAPHDVIATFDDMTGARQVVQELQMAGIDASQISLYGPAADEAADDPEVAEADARFTATMWRRSWIGGLIGLVIGALVGAVGAALVLRGATGSTTGVLLATVVGTGVLGLGTGAATGAVSSAQMSRAWELTFHSVEDGPVGVAVHSDDSDEAESAETILADHDPQQLERFAVPLNDP